MTGYAGEQKAQNILYTLPQAKMNYLPFNNISKNKLHD